MRFPSPNWNSKRRCGKCSMAQNPSPQGQIANEEYAMQIEAAIFRKPHDPLTIESIDLDKPMAREVLVRTVATGVCHSDLHVVDGVGRWPLDRPLVLGHEGAGVVEAVGADVT